MRALHDKKMLKQRQRFRLALPSEIYIETMVIVAVLIKNKNSNNIYLLFDNSDDNSSMYFASGKLHRISGNNNSNKNNV
jgi:regulatory protein YycH of two-component signal transduction system YycFG